jgi:hypothetical protein
MHASCRAGPCRPDSRTARLLCICQVRSDGVGEPTQGLRARIHSTGRMILPAAHLSYQHARSLPRSRHAVRDSDWLADIFQVMSVECRISSRSRLGPIWRDSPILGAHSRSAFKSWGAFCDVLQRTAAPRKVTVASPGQNLYVLRMTPARTS